MDVRFDSGQFRYRPYTCSIQATFEETMNEVETNLEFVKEETDYFFAAAFFSLGSRTLSTMAISAAGTMPEPPKI